MEANNENTIGCASEIIEEAKRRIVARLDELTLQAKAIREVYTDQVIWEANQAEARHGKREFNALNLIVERKDGSLSLRWSKVWKKKGADDPAYRRINTNGRAQRISGRRNAGQDGGDRDYSLVELRKRSPDYAHEAIQQAEMYARRIREEAYTLNAMLRSLQLRLTHMKQRLRRVEEGELRSTRVRFDYGQAREAIRAREALVGPDGRRRKRRRNFEAT